MKQRRYMWQGHLLYVTLVHGKWVVAYDGKCGDLSVVVNKHIKPETSSNGAQRRLDEWAEKEGLEEWRP